MRLFFAMVALMFAVPIAIGAVVAAAFAGWAGAAIAVIACIVLLVVGAVAIRFGFRTYRSVRDLVDLTERLSRGEYSARVSSDASPLLRPAADSFNHMAERLETSDDLRRRLLADLGHEMRTPLTIIRGELEAIADGVRDVDDESIKLLLADVAGMERLVDDLKSLSAAEAGVLALELEPTDLGMLVVEVAARFEREAADRSIDLLVTGEGSAGLEAEVDAHRISEVLSNVVMNALRATSSGGRIRLEVQADELDGQAAVLIEVTDDGAGIAPDQLPSVFERFHKGADSNGSGLGLTISRELVHAHGGTIDVASELGAGTTMRVRLPCAGPEGVGRVLY